jgi:hypothetical protein
MECSVGQTQIVTGSRGLRSVCNDEGGGGVLYRYSSTSRFHSYETQCEAHTTAG